MKKILLAFGLLFIFQNSFSQEKLGRSFFTGDVNFTLGINENYTPFNDDDETFLVPSALFFRVGFGYEFKRKLAVGFNAGYDYHWNYAVSAFPTYGSLKYNISEADDDAFFVEARYGKMWTPSSNYPDGNYYGLGLGVQVAGEKRWNTIIRLDFHRKGIVGFENDQLDSISFGIGFSFF
ncbi:hypothetical protein SAMN05216503_0120 [Polaribacter sp. KT25b]|uniref:hypothetical protein n=1 Tax=Polaribacter sp. KT25b TaxID=1855336 RepID=UPI00087DD8C5|nr:hypothetical protein [Polaribacter sp. KT25b]SDR66093.1 hypothetical protein SAMN05216503_0120 [Polaribacter sp. KT25b]